MPYVPLTEYHVSLPPLARQVAATGLVAGLRYLEMVVDYLRQTWPFWDNRNGKDHIFVTTVSNSTRALWFWSGSCVQPKTKFCAHSIDNMMYNVINNR